MLEQLLRPPPHRGPLIAAGAVVLATGLALLELRMSDRLGAGAHLLVLAASAALLLWLGLQAPNEDDRPPAYQSVLLVTGLVILYPALLRLAEVLGADIGDLAPGTIVWTSLIQAAVALGVALTRRSAVAGLIGAVALGAAFLATVDWLFEPSSFVAFRWLFALIALVLVLASLALRASRPRQAELLIDAAAVAILVIALQGLSSVVLSTLIPFGGPPGEALPNLWEAVVVGAGCGLMSYGAAERLPGPAWLGVANLLAFVAAASLGAEETLEWWPVALLVRGLGTSAAGLRPRDPLPPRPDGYGPGEQPLAARSGDDEIVLRVRDESPPTTR